MSGPVRITHTVAIIYACIPPSTRVINRVWYRYCAIESTQPLQRDLPCCCIGQVTQKRNLRLVSHSTSHNQYSKSSMLDESNSRFLCRFQGCGEPLRQRRLHWLFRPDTWLTSVTSCSMSFLSIKPSSTYYGSPSGTCACPGVSPWPQRTGSLGHSVHLISDRSPFPFFLKFIFTLLFILDSYCSSRLTVVPDSPACSATHSSVLSIFLARAVLLAQTMVGSASIVSEVARNLSSSSRLASKRP